MAQTPYMLANSVSCSEEPPIDPSLMECSLCCKTIKDPRSLPCFHSFCKECLITYIEKDEQLKSRSRFLCPVCRKQIPMRSLSKDSFSWDNSFPANNLLVALNYIYDNKPWCNPCRGRNDSKIKAKIWCEKCGLNFCHSCSEHHHQIFYNHVVDKVSDSNMEINKRCKMHKNDLNFVCLSHKEIACTDCIACHHKNCQQIKSLSEHVLTIKGSIKLSDLKDTVTNLKNLQDSLKDTLQKLSQDKQNSLKTIKNKRQEIDEHLDKLQAVLEEDLDTKIQETKNRVENVSSECTRLLHSLNMSAELIKTDLISENEIFYFGVNHRIRNELESCQKFIQVNANVNNNGVEIVFMPSFISFNGNQLLGKAVEKSSF